MPYDRRQQLDSEPNPEDELFKSARPYVAAVCVIVILAACAALMGWI